VKRGIIPPYVVIACSVVFFWSISVRALIYTVMPTIAGDLGLSSSEAGLAISLMLLGYTGGSWLAGWLPISRKRRILAGLLLSLLGAALLGTARSLPALLAAAPAVGLGVGVYLPLGLSLLVEAGGATRGAYYVAVHEVAATLGSFSGSAVVAVILLWTDWQGSLRLWAVVGLLAMLSFVLVADEKGGSAGRDGTSTVRMDGRLAASVLSYGIGTILVTGLISMLPLILVRVWGLEQAHAASLVGGTRLAGLLGVLIAGLAADRWGHARVLLGLQALCLIGGVAMSLGGFGPLFEMGVLVLAVGASGNIVLVPVVVTAAYPLGQRERAMAMTSGMGGFLGMVATPALFGILLDQGYGTGPIIATTISAAIMILATRRLAAHPLATG
jgi:MFS family permease